MLDKIAKWSGQMPRDRDFTCFSAAVPIACIEPGRVVDIHVLLATIINKYD